MDDKASMDGIPISLGAIQKSIAALDRLYGLLRKATVDGWKGIHFLKDRKHRAHEKEAVDHLVASLRKLHAFRRTALEQVEGILNGHINALPVYSWAAPWMQFEPPPPSFIVEKEEDYSDDSWANTPHSVMLALESCIACYEQIIGRADLFANILGQYYSDIVSLTLAPVFQTDELQNISRTAKDNPNVVRTIIALERDRLALIEKIADVLVGYKQPVPRDKRPSRKKSEAKNKGKGTNKVIKEATARHTATK